MRLSLQQDQTQAMSQKNELVHEQNMAIGTSREAENDRNSAQMLQLVANLPLDQQKDVLARMSDSACVAKVQMLALLSGSAGRA
ncbi:hypothetical protein COU76_00430 [Candidatus Peregrinibacteria bacterium CG10_big_fil_rev_8_21_14_0_10_49_10]|nr:MAG: hypothetical protein COU76_00430 [Candidatus Peregrinibacteria bacterium CG10_big_fil_rev_8_21_14_0_10_49_10]